MNAINGTPERKHLVLKDPYTVAGQEKLNLLKHLYEVTERTDVTDETKYEAYRLLGDEAGRRIRQLKFTQEEYQRKKFALVEKAIADYKLQMQADFVQKYSEQISSGKITQEIIDAMAELEAVATHNCFSIDGLKVQRRPCKGCERRSCKYAASE